MKKKFRPLIIALSAMLIAGIAYALVLVFIPEPPEVETQLPEYDTITPYQLKNLDRVDFRFDDGYEYTIDLTHKTESNRSYAVVGKTQYEYDFTALSSACLSVATISTSQAYAEDAMEAAVYGLDNPRAFVDIYGTDGTSVSLIVGDPTRIGNYCYVQVVGDDKVYLVSGYTARYLTQTDHAYRELGIFSYSDEGAFSEIAGIEITRGDEMILKYHLATEEEQENPPKGLAAGAYMEEPIFYPLNDVKLTAQVIDHIRLVNAKAVVEDNPQDLSKYGLDGDDVFHFNVDNADGSKVYMTISPAQEDGMRYALIGGIDSVYSFSASTFDFLEDVSYDKMLYGLFWNYRIVDCNAAEVELNGETYRMEFFDPTTEEEEAGKTFWATFNGEEMREENCRGLFVRMLSPSIYALVPEGYERPAEPYCVLRFETETGENPELSLYTINERQYAAFLDDVETGFLVKKDSIKEIADCIEIILEGDLVPDF